MAGSPTTTALERADAALEAGKTVEAERLYQEVLTSNANTTDATIQQQQLRDQEKALVKLGEMYRDQKNAAALSRTLSLSRSFMSSTSTAKAKTAKLIRTLLDFFGAIEGSEEVLKATLQENIEWARKEKRVFLKHSLETRLVGLYLDTQQYRPALALIDTLLTELKRLDDKMILTEVHLLESRVYRGVGNYAKAKAALTSSRTAANSIYCPPILQAQLDLQSGVLHAEDKDYTTAYSYFFEAFENFSAQGDDTAALGALKYMLLCKVMLNLPDDVNNLLTIKLATKYANVRDVESMRAIARAHQDRNLGEFERVLREFRGGESPSVLLDFRFLCSLVPTPPRAFFWFLSPRFLGSYAPFRFPDGVSSYVVRLGAFPFRFVWHHELSRVLFSSPTLAYDLYSGWFFFQPGTFGFTKLSSSAFLPAILAFALHPFAFGSAFLPIVYGEECLLESVAASRALDHVEAIRPNVYPRAYFRIPAFHTLGHRRLSRTPSLSPSFMFSTSTAKVKPAKVIQTFLDLFGAIEGSDQVLKATFRDRVSKKEKSVLFLHSATFAASLVDHRRESTQLSASSYDRIWPSRLSPYMGLSSGICSILNLAMRSIGTHGTWDFVRASAFVRLRARYHLDLSDTSPVIRLLGFTDSFHLGGSNVGLPLDVRRWCRANTPGRYGQFMWHLTQYQTNLYALDFQLSITLSTLSHSAHNAVRLTQSSGTCTYSRGHAIPRPVMGATCVSTPSPSTPRSLPPSTPRSLPPSTPRSLPPSTLLRIDRNAPRGPTQDDL
ncbi:hypothetical protein NMY22_g12043 [Coprinellus aureogranulatus]|nr:hypothetical protein NMY22_g12043 [Coprinellus aureogranulatus]